jgi:putative ABC transport system permease protein
MMLPEASAFRLAARRLRRTPAFTVATVVLIALCLSGVTFVFSVAQALLLGSIPYEQPDRLVLVQPTVPFADAFEELRGTSRLLEQAEAYVERAANIVVHGHAERALMGVVSPGYLSLAGVRPAAGRLFVSDDFRYASAPVVLITHELWTQRYAGSPDVIGSRLTIDGQPHDIAGVLPAGFRTIGELERVRQLPFEPRVTALLPLIRRAGRLDPLSSDRVARGLTIFAKMRDGVTLDQVNREAAPILDRVPGSPGTVYRFTRLTDAVVGDLPVRLLLLSIASVILLVVGCANLLNLLLARIDARRRELAICAALGASAGRLASGVITEILLLTGAGAALALWMAGYGTPLLDWLAGGTLNLSGARISAASTASGIFLLVGTGLVLGLWPVLRYLRLDAGDVLKDQPGGSQPAAPPGVLLTAQVMLAVALVIVSAVLSSTVIRSGQTELGFRPEGIVTAQIALDRSKYRREAATRFFSDLLDRTAALADVGGAALVSNLPGGPFEMGATVKVNGRGRGTLFAAVSPEYFTLMGIRVTAGRGFTDADVASSPRVMIVNEAFARRYWEASHEAVGRTVGWGEVSTTTAAGSVLRDIEWLLVGVVADARDIALAAAPEPKVYVSYQQLRGQPPTQMVILARSSTGDARALRQPLAAVARDLDPLQPLYNVVTLTEVLRSRSAAERALAAVLGTFAFVALLVAALGVYAAISVAGVRRRREVGIRLALGATRASVLRSIAWREGKLVAVGLWSGVLLGLLGLAVTQAFVTASARADVVTVTATIILVGGLSSLALIGPAWRATRVDPAVTLRAE